MPSIQLVYTITAANHRNAMSTFRGITLKSRERPVREKQTEGSAQEPGQLVKSG